MNHKKSWTLILLVIITLFSCKKNDLSKAQNELINSSGPLADELKGTSWVGEFKNPHNFYKELQPFSLELNKDGTFTWTELKKTEAAGKWVSNGKTIRLIFYDGKIISAEVSEDNWTNFKKISGKDFLIANIFRSAYISFSTLESRHFEGSIISSNRSVKVSLNFLPDNKVEQSGPTIRSNIYQYTLHGAGIRIWYPGFFGFFIFNANNTIKGYSVFKDPLW